MQSGWQRPPPASCRATASWTRLAGRPATRPAARQASRQGRPRPFSPAQARPPAAASALRPAAQQPRQRAWLMMSCHRPRLPASMRCHAALSPCPLCNVLQVCCQPEHHQWPGSIATTLAQSCGALVSLQSAGHPGMSHCAAMSPWQTQRISLGRCSIRVGRAIVKISALAAWDSPAYTNPDSISDDEHT